MKIKRGSTSVRRLIFIADSSSTTGAGLASLVYNAASLVAYYFAGDLSNEVQITLATATLGTFASGGFVAVDNTNMPGWYEIGIPDAALDGGNECAIQFRGAANMVPVNVYIELDAFDYQTATQPVNTTQFAGQTITAAAGVTIPSAIASPTNITAGTITTVTTLTGHTPQTGDSFARIGALGAGLTSLAPAATALSTATWTATIAGRIDVAVSTRASQTSVDTIDDLLDTELPALTAAIATVQSDTNDIQTRLPAALESGRIAAVLDSAVGTQITAIETFATRMTTGLVQDGAVYQFTANMLELGPSGGGGGDATLAKQTEILAAIQGSAVIQVASPNVSGNLVLTQGDDYDGVANPKASWTVTTDYTSGWTVRLTIRSATDAIIYTNTGTVVSSTVVAVTIAAPTGLTMTGCPGQWQGKFDVELTHSSGKKKTIALGVCYINEDQTR